MEWIKGIIAKLIGKQVGGEIGVSKAKLSAVVYVLVLGVQEISKAWGHPIEIPSPVFRFLEAAGLWSLRDSIKS